MRGARIRPALAACAAALLLLPLAGCSGSAAPQSAPTGWTDRMQEVLFDPDGQGALSGGVPGGGDLESVRRGAYRLVAACTGVGIVHVAARTTAGHLLGESDVPCGATIGIPITVHSTGLELRVTSKDEGDGSFYLAVNRASWTQAGSYEFG